MVVVDVRNRYESAAGKFANAIACDIEHFRELPAYLEQLDVLRNRKILMYCTGGIRCEKASALFRARGFKQVFQLHGGIVTYQEEFGNEHWLGECFVFDQRMTVRVDEALVPIGQCAHTGRPTNRFVNCLHDPCHVLFLLAEETERENPATRPPLSRVPLQRPHTHHGRLQRKPGAGLSPVRAMSRRPRRTPRFEAHPTRKPPVR